MPGPSLQSCTRHAWAALWCLPLQSTCPNASPLPEHLPKLPLAPEHILRHRWMGCRAGERNVGEVQHHEGGEARGCAAAKLMKWGGWVLVVGWGGVGGGRGEERLRKSGGEKFRKTAGHTEGSASDASWKRRKQ